MSASNDSPDSPVPGLFLLYGGAILMAKWFWWMWIVDTAIPIAILAGCLYIWHKNDAKELLRRADQQHALLLAGDSRGIYGDYPPSDLNTVV